MDAFSLETFIATPELHETILVFARATGAVFSIVDNQGRLLVGQPRQTGTSFPVRLGGVALGRVIGDAKSEAVAALLSSMASQEAQKRRFSQEALQRLSEIQTLSHIAGRTASAQSPAEVCRVVMEESKRLFGADDIAIALKDGGILTASEQGEASSAEPGDAERSFARSFDTETMISAPLKVQGKVIGVINVSRPKAHGYSSGDTQLLNALAVQAAASIESARLYDKLNSILKTLEEINRYTDVETILDRILFEARQLANADAGSIFLAEEGVLTFSYVHNDTLFKGSGANAAIYASYTVPITEESIVGYAALTGRSVCIDDAYNLTSDLPYSFNSSYDSKTGYRTTSILTIPLKTYQGRLLGVMQILNARDEAGRPAPFSGESRTYIPLFASNAAAALERGVMTRERILRMMKLAEMRDPNETGAHVQRVGAYSAEIFQRWAKNRGMDVIEIKRFRDLLRIGAMLHDVGKVAISDAILKKPGPLTAEEFQTMKLHTIYGAQLFANAVPELDKMCFDIALGHHERWNGSGYPGLIQDIMAPAVSLGVPRKGEAIPLSARISALADVYDALRSRRVYKEPWPEDKVIGAIREESGKHFDPEIVEAFFQILDVIRAIREKYQDLDD